jgi:hypothetical protein
MNIGFKLQSEENETPFEIGFGYEGIPSNEVLGPVELMENLVGTLADIIAGVGVERVDELLSWAKHGDEDQADTLYRLSEHRIVTSLGDTISCFLAGEQPPLPDLGPEAD